MSNQILADEIDANSTRLHIAVASNFHSTLLQLTQAFTQKNRQTQTINKQPEKNITFIITSASTGKLTTQIRYGAPFDVFLSADQKHVKLLIEEELAEPSSYYNYAQGQLALVYKNHIKQATKIDATATDILQSGHVQLLALANHKTAPYGLVARNWLLENDFKGNNFNDNDFQLITAENIIQAWQYFDQGGVDAALVALSSILQAKSQSNSQNYTYKMLPNNANQQLRQALIILKAANNKVAAKRFLAFLQTSAAKNLITKAGYRVE